MQLWDYVWLRVPAPATDGRGTAAEDAWLDLLRDVGLRGWEAVAAVVVPSGAAERSPPSGALRILLKRPAGSAHPYEVR